MFYEFLLVLKTDVCVNSQSTKIWIDSYFLGINHMPRIVLDRVKDTEKAFQESDGINILRTVGGLMVSFVTQTLSVIGVQ